MANKENNLIIKIESIIDKLSKSQKLIARYITGHYDKAAFMTAALLAKTVGTSESTVVRFATEIGYTGYPDFQKALQEVIRTKLTAVQRMEMASSRIGEQDILTTVLTTDMEKIKKTLEEINKKDFEQIVEDILKAKKIYILGVRSSASLADFLGFYLNLLFDNVSLVHTNSVSEVFEQILRTGPDDVFIGISFPRYSKRTVKALKYAHTQGSKVVAITDSKQSPLTAYADNIITARSDMASFADSLVAPLSVINALIVALGMKKKDEVQKTFVQLENIWDEYNIYEQ